MVNSFNFPPMGFGPGSQPPEGDGQELEYMPMPQGMRAYSAHVPDVEADDALMPAMSLMKEIAAAADRVARGGENEVFDLAGLDAANRALVAETMGEGEVAIKVHDIPAVAVQESVFAGVWGLKAAGMDAIEVGSAPRRAFTRAFAPCKPATLTATAAIPGVVNALPILTELVDKSVARAGDDLPHVVNLTLLPHTEQDLAWLDLALGKGSVDILSRGYGNCRITATALDRVWRVQFFNSMDTLILDTFEVTDMPEVALAASEDLAESSARILEVLEAIR
ncbi:MAG: hydrogenase expression/formation protein [Roseovarius sp.]